MDDGIRAGLISLEQLREQDLVGRAYDDVRARYPSLDDRRLVYEIIRHMIDTVVTDLIEQTRCSIDEASPASIDDVRKAGKQLVAMSDPVFDQHLSLKKFLNQHLYRHEKKLEMTATVQAVLRDLFSRYMADEALMPPEFAEPAAGGSDADRARIVADYIAGMTDRFALAEHERIVG